MLNDNAETERPRLGKVKVGTHPVKTEGGLKVWTGVALDSNCVRMTEEEASIEFGYADSRDWMFRRFLQDLCG